MSNQDKKNLSRRDFLKTLGIAGITTAGLAGCVRTKDTAAGSEIPTDKMTFRTNHNTGDKVSLLGFGMMRLPSIDGKSAREGSAEPQEEIIDQQQVNELVDYAIAHGVNYFDTSPAYCKGKSEHATGIALSRHPRDKYFVATKLSNFAPNTWSHEASVEIYHNSMKELQVDHIDYLLLHGIGMGGMENFNCRYIKNGMLDFLMEERKAGRIRNLGFSYHGDVEVFDYLLSKHDEYHWDFAQIQLNYVDWKHAKEVNERNTNAEYLYNELHKRNIPVVIMEPLLGGRLSNVPTSVFTRFKEKSPEQSVASWAFRFAGSKPDVLTTLSGMTKMEHLQDNLRTFSPLKPLTEEEFTFLEDMAVEILSLNTIPCNDCKYCMPCPYGLDIPATLLYYNKCLSERNVPKSTQDENYRKARRAFLIGYDRSVPKIRQADHCIGCGKCKIHCPQRIDIPAEMQRISLYVDMLKQNKIDVLDDASTTDA